MVQVHHVNLVMFSDGERDDDASPLQRERSQAPLRRLPRFAGGSVPCIGVEKSVFAKCSTFGI